jgi:hypothetical protein
MGYPDYEGFGYTFARAELTLNRSIYVAISNVSFDQPTNSAVVMGTRPFPLMHTEGEMGAGEGSVTFSDAGEWARFLADLGNGYRSRVWGLSWVLTATGKSPIKLAAQGCKIAGTPIDHGTGEEALGGEVSFVALTHTINGLAPHLGMPAPLR